VEEPEKNHQITDHPLTFESVLNVLDFLD